MAIIMRCECGEITSAETEDELVASVERHIAEQHPALVGKLTRADILGMAEVV